MGIAALTAAILMAMSAAYAQQGGPHARCSSSFSKLGIVMGDAIEVPREAGARELEVYRQRVEAALNETTAKAYNLAGADMIRATPLTKVKSLS